MPRSISGMTVLSYDDTQTGLVYTGTVAAGYPPTTAGIFATGAQITGLSSGTVYTNTGTSAVPVWSGDAVATVSLTAANLIAMYATPVMVVAPVAGRAIIVDSVDLVIARTATAFTGGGTVAVQYDSTINGAGTATHATIAAAVVTGAAGTTYTARIPVVLSDVASASIAGLGLFVSNITAAFAAGTGTATLSVHYHLV